MILLAMEHSLPWHEVQQVLDEMALALSRFDCDRARARLLETVAEYRPRADIQDLLWSRRSALAHAEANMSLTADAPRTR